MKRKNKTPEKELNKMETHNLPEAEFKTLVIRTLDELRRVDEFSKNFNKQTGNIKKNQSEMTNISIITAMKNTLQGIASRAVEAESQISDLVDKVAENKLPVNNAHLL